MSVSNTNGNAPTPIAEMMETERLVILQVVVLEHLGSYNTHRDNQTIHTYRVADHTGSINFNIWGDLWDGVAPGDILHIKGVYKSVYKGQYIAYLTKGAVCTRVGRFEFLFSETPDFSKIPVPPPPDSK